MAIPPMYEVVQAERIRRGMVIPVNQKFHLNSTNRQFGVHLVPFAIRQFSIWAAFGPRLQADPVSCAPRILDPSQVLLVKIRDIYDS